MQSSHVHKLRDTSVARAHLQLSIAASMRVGLANIIAPCET